MNQEKDRQSRFRKKDTFSDKVSTRIWQDIASENNPYNAKTCLCHGYDLTELLKKRSYIEVVYLLFRGELPSTEQAELFERLFIVLINPGPRHPATRAAMNAGVGKTYPEHILPIGISVLGGSNSGGAEVADAMRFLKKNVKYEPSTVADELFKTYKPPKEGDWHIAPGFGSRFNDIDLVPKQVANILSEYSASGQFLSWGIRFAEVLNNKNMGMLITAVAGAVLLDLGFHPRTGAGLFQLASSPGLLAHGLELANKPTTAMPFVSDENYIIEDGNESN